LTNRRFIIVNDGMLGCWNNGKLEWWNGGIMG